MSQIYVASCRCVTTKCLPIVYIAFIADMGLAGATVYGVSVLPFSKYPVPSP